MAVWLLSPETREERVLRALRWYAQDFRDECRASKDVQRRDGWLGRIKDTALARGLDTSAATRKLTTTEVVEGADSLVPGTHTAWQAFSGMAHSRMWAPMGLLDTEVLSRDKDYHEDDQWFSPTPLGSQVSAVCRGRSSPAVERTSRAKASSARNPHTRGVRLSSQGKTQTT